MQEEISRHPLNAPGRYYVDCNTCLDHEYCVHTAPNNFRLDEAHTAYVFKQPVTLEEETQCRQALEECPVAAIHNDSHG
jgi:ferredoxin